jgi:hypothetical protein
MVDFPVTKAETNLRFICSLLKHALTSKEIDPLTWDPHDQSCNVWKFQLVDTLSADIKTLYALGADVETTLAIFQSWIVPGRHVTEHLKLTGLHVAVMHQDGTFTCQLLFSMKANINARDSLDYTPLHYATLVEDVEHLKRNSLEKRSCKILDYLVNANERLQLNLDLESRTLDDGMTPFLTAASVANVDAMEILLKQGANVHAKDNAGRSAVHYMAKYKEWMHSQPKYSRFVKRTHQYIVKLVEENGVDPQERDTLGKCALDFYPPLSKCRYQLIQADLCRRREPYLQVMRACKFVIDANERKRIRDIQETMDKSCPLVGISRSTAAKNHAYLVSQVFSQEHIVKRVLDFL